MLVLVLLSALAGVSLAMHGPDPTNHGVALPCNESPCPNDEPISIGQRMEFRESLTYKITVNSEENEDGELPSLHCLVRAHTAPGQIDWKPCETDDSVEDDDEPHYMSKNGFECQADWESGDWDYPATVCTTTGASPVNYSWYINHN